MSLSDMSENTIRIGNATIAGDTLQVSVSYLQPSESDGDTPGESRLSGRVPVLVHGFAEYRWLVRANRVFKRDSSVKENFYGNLLDQVGCR